MRFGPVGPTLSGIPLCSVPPGATRTTHPLLRFGSSSGSAPEDPSSTSLDANTLSWACLAVRRIRSEEIHVTPEDPNSRVMVRVQGFAPSSRLAPSSASRVYFTPQTPFGFSLQGFPSQGAATILHRRGAVLPFLRRLRFPSPSRRDRRHIASRALGARDDAFSDFTALLPLRVRSIRARVSAHRASVPLLGFSLSRVYPAKAMCAAHHRSLLPGASPRFAPSGFPDGARVVALRSFARLRWWHRLSRGRLPLVRFLAAHVFRFDGSGSGLSFRR
jgi:hypothetical protein